MNACDFSGAQVVALRASTDGDRVMIRVKGMLDGKAVFKTFSLRVEEYAALGFALRDRTPLTAEMLERLEAAARASGAYSRGLHILGYGANSARTLEKKLTEKGFSHEVAQRAVGALSERGYLQEERDACRAAGQIFRRGRGMRRIMQELRAKGYGDEALQAARESLANEDFVTLCVQVAQKKCRVLPAERAEREKLAAYLLRCGFENAQIRAAFDRLLSDREP